MAVQIQLRHDTATNWDNTNPILAIGEIGINTDNHNFKVGDGVTPWLELNYVTSTITSANNVGTSGVGVYAEQVDGELQFKKLNALSSKLDLTDDTSNSKIDIDIGTLNISDLSDSNLASLTAGDILLWDSGTSKWLNSNKLIGIENERDNIASASRMWGGSITDNGDGTVAVAAGGGIVKSQSAAIGSTPTSLNDGQGSSTTYITWDAVASLALTPNAYNYIYYNGDTSSIEATTDFYSIDFTRAFTIGRVYHDGTNVIIRLCGTNAWNFNRRVQLFGEERFPIERAKGMVVGNPSGLYISVTSGVLWAELVNRFTTDAFDSSGTDTFTYWYTDGTGGFNSVVSQSEIDNLNYDNSGTLTTLLNNNYGVHWIYMVHDSSVHVVYGKDTHNRLADATEVEPPTELPGILDAYSTLIGRVIVQKDSSILESVESAHEIKFSTTGIMSHTELADVTADDHHNKLHDIDSTADHNGVTGATENNIVSFDENGLPKDSGRTTTEISNNTTHRTSDGTDHTYINQDVTSEGTPSFNSVTLNNTSTDANSAVRYDQLTSMVAGLDWQDSVTNSVDFTTSEPSTPVSGDRYINTATGDSSITTTAVVENYIYEWNGTSWNEIVVNEGFTVWNEALDNNYTFNGTNWVTFGSTVSHNNTSGLQGGTTSEYYHLTSNEYDGTAFTNINADKVDGKDVDDTQTTTDYLWTASKINSELGSKADSTSVPTTIADLDVNSAALGDGKALEWDVETSQWVYVTYNNYSHPNHTGDVTSTGDGATVIANKQTLTASNGVNISNTPEVIATLAPEITLTYGTEANTVCEGNDSRLSDARTPTSHTHPLSELEQSTATDGQVALWNNTTTAWEATTLTASNISDFDAEVSNNTDVAANTTARHEAVTVTDSTEIDFTLTGQEITAALKDGSIALARLTASVQTSLGKADTALQSGDNVSELTNDAGYVSDVSDKADKQTLATENNFASFDATGNIQDAGVSDASYADASHTHDDRYYTETEADASLQPRPVVKVDGTEVSNAVTINIVEEGTANEPTEGGTDGSNGDIWFVYSTT